LYSAAIRTRSASDLSTGWGSSSPITTFVSTRSLNSLIPQQRGALLGKISVRLGGHNAELLMEVIRAKSSPSRFYCREEDYKSELQTREVGIKFFSRYAGGNRMISPILATPLRGHWPGGIDKESAPGSGLDWKPPPQLDAFLAFKDFCRKHWPDTHENVSLKFRFRIHVCSTFRITALNQPRSLVPSALLRLRLKS
jgi:hypothetical protein